MSAVHKPTYMSWKGAKQRCRDPKHHAYGRYGGRGITFTPRWDRFEDFLADMGERPEGMTLDRKDNDKGYDLENCQWATMAVQARNRVNNIRYEFRGQQLCLSEISELVGIPTVNIRRRLYRGWSLADATMRGSIVGLDPVAPGVVKPKRAKAEQSA